MVIASGDDGGKLLVEIDCAILDDVNAAAA